MPDIQMIEKHTITAYEIHLAGGQSIVVENIDGQTSYVLDDDGIKLSYSGWGEGFQNLNYDDKNESDILRCGKVFLMRNCFLTPDIESLRRVLDNVTVHVTRLA